MIHKERQAKILYDIAKDVPFFGDDDTDEVGA
jgi:hypothetical protein